MEIYKQQTTEYLEWLRDRIIEENSANPHIEEIVMKINSIIEERRDLAETTPWRKIENAECIWTIDILVKENWVVTDVIKGIPCGWLCWWECWLQCKNI